MIDPVAFAARVKRAEGHPLLIAEIVREVQCALEAQRAQIAGFVQRCKIRFTITAPDGSSDLGRLGCEEIADAIRAGQDETE